MGTRADFYVGRGEAAEWIGSIAWDGGPGGIVPNEADMVPAWRGGPLHPRVGEWPKGAHLFDATTQAEYRARVERFFQYRDDVTRPVDGWPWPWEDSRTTDYAYAFDGGKVWASSFGYEWFDPMQPEPDIEDERTKTAVFPHFTKDRNPRIGSKKSGVMVIELTGDTP